MPFSNGRSPLGATGPNAKIWAKREWAVLSRCRRRRASALRRSDGLGVTPDVSTAPSRAAKRDTCTSSEHNPSACALGGLHLSATMGANHVNLERETQCGALATRNPTMLFTTPGELNPRVDARARFVLPYHEPPRSTRNVPVAGPGGFVDGLDA